MDLSNDSSYPLPYVVLMCFLWAGMLLQNVAMAFFIHIPGCGSLGEYFVPGVIVILVLLSLLTLIKQIKIWDILFYCFIVACYLISYTRHPENRVVLDELKDGFFYNTLLLYFFGVVLDFDALKKQLYYVSLATVYISFIWYFVLNISGGIDFTSGNWDGGMSTAYAMLPHVMFVIWQFMEKPNWVDGLALALGSVFMLSMGNRGSITSLLVFVVLFLFLFKEYEKNGKTIKLAMIALVGVFYFFLDVIFLFFGGLVLLVGGDMRIIEKFANKDELLDDSGREAIREKLIDSIQLNVGRGFAGDKGLIGTYSHNLFFEWAVSFGVIITVLLCIMLVWLIVKAYRNSPTHDEKIFVLLLTCCILKLMFSGTFLADSLFFVFIGFLVHQCRIPKFEVTDNIINDSNV